MLRIPFEMYELNLIPGKANMLLAPLARTIFICFGASSSHFKRSCSLVDYPVRFPMELRKGSQLMALQAIKLSTTKKSLLILGGSQGSTFINNAVKQWLIDNPHLHHVVQVIHQTGAHDATNWQEFYASLNIPAITFDYAPNIEYYYIAADLIICRSGAGTLFEIQFFNKRCITLPLETASTNHQIKNAQALADQHPFLFTVIGNSELVKDPTLLPRTLTQQLLGIINYETSFTTKVVSS